MNANKKEVVIPTNYDSIYDIDKIDDIIEIRKIYSNLISEIKNINDEILNLEIEKKRSSKIENNTLNNDKKEINTNIDDSCKLSTNFKRKPKKESQVEQKNKETIDDIENQNSTLLNMHNLHNIHDQRLKLNYDHRIKSIIENKNKLKHKSIVIINENYERELKIITEKFYEETTDLQMKIKKYNEELENGTDVNNTNLNNLISKINEEVNEINLVINDSNADISRCYALIDDSDLLINQAKEIKNLITKSQNKIDFLGNSLNVKIRSRSVEFKKKINYKFLPTKAITQRYKNENISRFEFDRINEDKIIFKEIALSQENDKLEEMNDSSFSFEQEFDSEICNNDEFKINKINNMNIDSQFFDKKNKFLK